MERKPPNKADDRAAQSGRFIDVARRLGADEDEAAFKEKLGVIARQKPKRESAAQVKRKDKAE